MSNLKPLIIVLSRNYSTGLGVIRSLGAAGYTVDLIASVKKQGSSIIASSSKYVRKSQEVLTQDIQGDKGAGLVQAVMNYAQADKNKSAPETMVLFPTDDFTASVVDSNREILRKHFLIPHITEGSDLSIVDFMDKTLQGKLARAAGLLTPLEWIVSLKEDVQVPADVVYPCFVKPLESISGHKTEIAVCRDQSQLEAQLSRMKEFYSDRSVLVQEYLHIDKEYDLSGVCLDEEVVIPGIIEKTGIANHELGVTMSGKMLPPDTLGETLEHIKTLLKQFHYVGMFDMELNVCGDKIYFNEVNFRSGGPNFAYFLNGVNLPELFVKAITGETYGDVLTQIPSFGKTFVYEKVAWEDYIYGYMNRAELHRCIDSADFTLLVNGDDPAPGKHFEKRIRLSALKHRVKGFAGRKPKTKTVVTENHQAEENFCAVVIGRNYGNILTMTRDLGMAGYGVEVLRVYKNKPKSVNPLAKMKPDACSKYVRNFHTCIAGGNPQKVIDALLDMDSTGKEKPLLVPVDDYTAQVVDENLDQLRDYYILPSISDKEGEISRLMDKDQQKKLAAAFSLPMLDSVLVKSEKGQFTLPQGIQYPCFIKPNISSNSTKARMMKCADEAELRRVLAGYAKNSDFELLVETFADIQTEYSLLGVSTTEGVIAPGLFKAVVGGHKERKGVALMGETVSTEPLQPLIDQCIDFVQSLHYTGLFDIDLIETKDGNVYFVELNFRAGASIHAFTQCGMNLSAMYADNLIKGKELDFDCRLPLSGKKFISEKVLLEEYVRGDVSRADAEKLMDLADIYFIKNEDDPKPYSHFQRYFAVATGLRVPYRVRDRIKDFRR